MRFGLYSILIFLVQFSHSQDVRKYYGNWYSSSMYTQSIYSLKRDGKVKWVGSGCTFKNEKMIGKWEFKNEYIEIYLHRDTIKLTLKEDRLISYKRDSSYVCENCGYYSTLWRYKIGLRILRKKSIRIREREANRR